MRHTKIICTLGPACTDPKTIEAMIRAGMNVARLNFSHATHDEHLQRIQAVREAEARVGVPVGILLDTRGPELRTGKVESGTTLELPVGAQVLLRGQQETARVRDDGIISLSINYALLPTLVEVGMHLYISDGLIDLQVTGTRDDELECVVVSGGAIGSYKNVNIPGMGLPLPSVSERDLQDISFGLSHGIDFIALSFIRRASDLLPVRNLVRSKGPSASGVRVIAKIESDEGVQNIDEILLVADGVMIARGDLGIQLPTDRVALVQKQIIRQCNRAGKPVVTATQMLESMTVNVRPTRAEMTDVANAIFDGSDALMLSGETAVGAHPCVAITTLDNIARAVESSGEFRALHGLYAQRVRASNHHDTPQRGSRSDAAAKATVVLAEEGRASAIVVPTVRGTGPRWVARHRPRQPVVAVTTSIEVARRLLVGWGIAPLLSGTATDTNEMLENAIAIAIKHGYVREHEWVVLAAGVPLDSPVTLNSISLRYIGEILRRGTGGFGRQLGGEVVVVERERVGTDELNAQIAGEQSIAVVRQLGKWMVPVLQGVRAVVSELPSSLSPYELLEHNSELVVIEGVGDATTCFTNGQRIEVNGDEKIIYESE